MLSTNIFVFHCKVYYSFPVTKVFSSQTVLFLFVVTEKLSYCNLNKFVVVVQNVCIKK